MLQLRDMGLLNLDVLTASGEKLSTLLAWWEESERRQAAKASLQRSTGVDANQVIMGPDAAKKAGLASTVVFPSGNIAPQGSVIKATAIDPAVVGEDNIYRHRGPARIFTSERAAMAAIKGQSGQPLRPGDVLVLVGGGPTGTGMEETYQVTSALKFLPWGKSVPVLTDARFSGVSTGACVGHIGPEALAGGPIGKLRDGDIIEIEVDRNRLSGRLNLVEAEGRKLSDAEASELLAGRPPHPDLGPHPDLPDDTRLWAALQRASGGVWAGCVYDVDKIIALLEAGLVTLADGTNQAG
jgi:dihydroxyacid dehydratase/phosphogluconate dehydratase